VIFYSPFQGGASFHSEAHIEGGGAVDFIAAEIDVLHPMVSLNSIGRRPRREESTLDRGFWFIEPKAYRQVLFHTRGCYDALRRMGLGKDLNTVVTFERYNTYRNCHYHV
jgi:hypothetical protein